MGEGTTMNRSKAKPFLKWVGGKGQLIGQLETCLPVDFDQWDRVTYIEPFVGGGAMLFHMLQTYPNIVNAVINDINPDLGRIKEICNTKICSNPMKNAYEVCCEY